MYNQFQLIETGLCIGTDVSLTFINMYSGTCETPEYSIRINDRIGVYSYKRTYNSVIWPIDMLFKLNSIYDIKVL